MSAGIATAQKGDDLASAPLAIPNGSPFSATDSYSAPGIGTAAVFERALERHNNEWVNACKSCGSNGCSQRCRVCPTCTAQPGFFGGAEFLLIRPHFSEAIAFAQGTQTPNIPTSIDISGRELQFDYEGSGRAFVGYRLGRGDGDIRFTYWNFQGDTQVDGSAPGPGQFIVDPFGNLVGSITIVDPNSALFGMTIPGGALIQTRAIVKTNVYDLDYNRPVVSNGSRLAFSMSIGARIADIEQFYESVISSAGGAFFSGGDFSADFIGAGPRAGFECRQYLDDGRSFSLFANGHGALLLGEYEVRSTQRTTTAPLLRGTQTESLTRMIPVAETELGATWRAADWLDVSIGWLFQAWFDMGTSGGKFGGLFTGADDANNMSFDGLFVRGEVTF